VLGKRKHPKAEIAAAAEDIAEARRERAATHRDLEQLNRTAPLIHRLAGLIIDRQGKNHYIELLYHHTREAS
jgi:hypothetical protein